jgi:hypothetical protein
MTLDAARALWGSDVVQRVLADDAPDSVNIALLDEIAANTDPPGRLRSWALAQPWPRFCAIVRVLSGEVRREVAEGAEPKAS